MTYNVSSGMLNITIPYLSCAEETAISIMTFKAPNSL